MTLLRCIFLTFVKAIRQKNYARNFIKPKIILQYHVKKFLDLGVHKRTGVDFILF